MKTNIQITGQTVGNRTLLNAIQTHDCTAKDAGFGNFTLIFNTKKEAKKALWEGFKYLKRQEPTFVYKWNYSSCGWLKYDASKAYIEQSFKGYN